MKKNLLSVLLLVVIGVCKAQNLITENFDVFPATWIKVNTSVPAGANQWGQASTNQITYFGGGTGAYNGTAATSYAFANFNSTTGNNTISNWLITPIVSLIDGDVISFYSSKGLSGGTNVYADNLQLRISPNGSTAANPVGPTSVGDFTILALDINPTLSTSVYPNAWTLYSYTVTGLPVATSCKIAFRYFVPNGGPLGTNSDQVAIDQFSVDRTLSTPDFFANNFTMHPNPVSDVLNITSINQTTIESAQIIDINGRTVQQMQYNTNTIQINASKLSAGVYFVKIQSELGLGTSKFIKH